MHTHTKKKPKSPVSASLSLLWATRSFHVVCFNTIVFLLGFETEPLSLMDISKTCFRVSLMNFHLENTPN